MRAMVCVGPGRPLELTERPEPIPGPGQVLLNVRACGVCRTDLHLVAGEVPNAKFPVVPGHQIVGVVAGRGEGVRLRKGERVGVPWLGWTCGKCHYCISGRENLCEQALFTGAQLDGGFAEKCAADARFCFSIPEVYSDLEAAPLLCAGLIGYRAFRLAGEAQRLGFYGFGSAGHILIQVARYEGREVCVFTRRGDVAAKTLARELGAEWAGDSGDMPPAPLDAAIIFAPVGDLVPEALKAVAPGGKVVCAGIHMSDIPSFPYSLIWREREIKSVANLTRRDGEEFLRLAPKVPVRAEITAYSLAEADRALADLKQGRLQGSAVLDLRAEQTDHSGS